MRPNAGETEIVNQVAATTDPTRTLGRILLVEDLEHNRDLARTVLANVGHKVDTAENGAEAVAAVQLKTYDLVLMDVQMPVMDGVTATKKIRELAPPVSSIPIIAMTANVLPRQVISFREAGINDHVGKPFKKAELLETVNTWLMRIHPTLSSQQLHDTTALDEVRKMMGADWVTSGLTRLQLQIAEAFGDEAAALRERELTARRAHALVSHAALLGFLDLSKLCAKLEEACTSGQDLYSPLQQAKGSAHIADGLVREQLTARATQVS